MLDAERLGQRSGTRPVVSSYRSQKKRNVRSWMSSKRGGSPADGRASGAVRGAHENTAAASTAAATRLGTARSEAIGHAELEAALGILARGLAEVRVRLGQRRDELLVARVVVRVE